MIKTRLHDKKIIVTGASSGIGEQLCRKIAENGGIPIMLARSDNKLTAIQVSLNSQLNAKSFVYKVDLQNKDDIDLTINRILVEHEQIHGLINNAGIGVFDAVEDIKWPELQQTFQLNVFSLMRITQLIIPHFNHYGQGHIMNVASQAGKIATPKSAAYGASKHAVLGFTNTLRQEMDGKGIFVTAVNLGPVRTNFFKAADPSGTYQQSVDRYMLDPNRVAHVIIRHLFTKKREINMPFWMEAGSIFYRLFPSLMEKLFRSSFNKK
ncbi:SDR family NAD(P)-dependent oxidoreductase [Oceanobacillus polygoni]|uniref:Short-subunit dehydrogenase n=1 Tax=Oceanobacillus polygoni TaxID=1235259 RepID=A0A9X0YRY7_9BACI|nr:SDR family oxidoreductase [Oceanobacillus polygoni]MBP2077790.1 short-subunit dehydrogenase [Oceanobacillus polygoni]